MNRPQLPHRAGLPILCAILCAIPAALAPTSALHSQTASDSVARSFFPPRLVLLHAEAIGLSEEQRATIQSEATTAAEQFADLRYDLEGALHRLIGLAHRHPVDEDEALTQLDEVLDLERRIKRLQLSLVVRVKNVLTPDQQDRLRELRRRSAEPEAES